MMKVRISHTLGFGSITGMYVPFLSAEVNLATILYIDKLLSCVNFPSCAHWQVRGDDADDPNTYVVAFGEREARYMVNCVLLVKLDMWFTPVT